MKRYLYILLLILTLPVNGRTAKNSGSQTAPVNNEQFLYYFYAARQAIMAQDYPKALVLLDFCEQLNPRDGKTKDNLGIIYHALGDTVRAGILFQQAYEYAPDDCWHNYADFLLNQTEWKKAQKILENVTKRNPKDEEAAEYLLNIYLHNFQWKKALAQQDKLDAIAGYDGQSALNRYRIYLSWKKPKQAVAEIDKYLEQDPESLYFLVLRAKIYLSASDHTGVNNTCRKIASLAPYDKRDIELIYSEQVILYGVAAALTETAGQYIPDEPAKAFECYEQALQLLPQNAFILNNYAYSLALFGNDLSKAERMSALTIKDEPDNASYLDTYGWILHLQGQDMLALFYLRKALENVAAEDVENQSVIEEHLAAITQAAQPKWHTAHTVISLNVNLGSQSMKVNCVAFVERDSLITVSIMPMLGMEMYRVEVSPDEVLVIDKMNKRFARAALSMIPNIIWKDLQDIIAAEGKKNGDTASYDELLAMIGIRASAKATYINIIYDGTNKPKHMRLDKYTEVPAQSLFGL